MIYHSQISSFLRLLALCLVRPDLFVIHYCLFIFSKNSLLSLVSLFFKLQLIMRKGTFWKLRKVSTLVRLCEPRSLTRVDTFRSWQIFCVLNNNSTLINCHFKNIDWYQPVLSSFPPFPHLFHLGVLIRSLFT